MLKLKLKKYKHYKMEKKYYTPSIEEFHVGFEYEINQNNKWIKKEFNPVKKDDSITSNLFEFDDVYKRLKSITNRWDSEKKKVVVSYEEIRVKHLDREDIESCLGDEFKEHTHPLDGQIKLIKGSIWSEAISVSLYEGVLEIKEYNFQGENNPNSCKTVFKGNPCLYRGSQSR